MFRFYFKSKIKMIFIWTAIIIFFLAASLTKYAAFAEDAEGTKNLLDTMPKIVMIVYGMNELDITSLGGYFALVSLYIAIMLSIYGGMLGSKIVYEEEDLSTSEFIFTRPISRSKVYFSKFAVALVTITLLNIFVIVGNYLMLKINYEVFDGFWMMCVVQYVLCIFGLCLGSFLTSLKINRFATIASAGIVTSLFLVKAVGEIKEIDLSLVTPFYAFNYNDILTDNFNIMYVAYYLVISLVLLILGSVLLNKRDIG